MAPLHPHVAAQPCGPALHWAHRCRLIGAGSLHVDGSRTLVCVSSLAPLCGFQDRVGGSGP